MGNHNRRIAAIGTFDGVHLGHRAVVDYLCDEGRRRSLRTAVVTFASHPLAVVAPERVPRSLCSPTRRELLLRQAGVDDVIMLPFNQTVRRLTAREFLAMLHDSYDVDAIVIGFNNSFGCDRLLDFADYAKASAAVGIKALPAPRYVHPGFGEVSSTAIRRLIAEGDVILASQLLGRAVSLSGTVVGGKRLGRTIGFPTANILTDPTYALPAEGVYACRAYIGDLTESYAAMVNIGRCPTVDDSSLPPVSVEAHLIGFDGDLYDSTVTIEFVSRIRDEHRFDSLDALTHQLAHDREAVIKLVH